VEAVEAASGRREVRRQGGNKRAVRPDRSDAARRSSADKRGAGWTGGEGDEVENGRRQKRRTTGEMVTAGVMTRELG
jgi:hypothetical protein